MIGPLTKHQFDFRNRNKSVSKAHHENRARSSTEVTSASPSSTLTTELTKAEIRQMLNLLSPNDPFSIRLNKSLLRKKQIEESVLTRDKLERDLRIHVTENGQKIEVLPSAGFTKRKKHRNPTAETAQQKRKKAAMKLLKLMTPEQKQLFINQLK